jgi:hypothetical protein
VNITVAGLGTKRVRIANQPPEVSNDTLRATLAPYDKIVGIQNERWSKTYRYAVDNGVRQVTMVLSRHAPSHLTVAGQRVLLSYEGQPATCYGCGEPGHMYQGCPARRKLGSARTIATAATYASIITDSAAMQEESAEVTVTGGGNVDNEGAAPSTVGKWSLDGDDTSATGAQVEAPDKIATSTELATPEGPDRAGAETSQSSAFGEPRQRTGKPGPHDDFPMLRDGASRILSVKSRGSSPLRRWEEAGAKSECEDGAMSDKDDTPLHRGRERTQEDLRRSPKRTKKMKLDKNGDQQQERSRSLPRKASSKSVKV